MSDELGPNALRIVAAYQAELKKQRGRAERSWAAIERRVTAFESSLDEVEGPSLEHEPDEESTAAPDLQPTARPRTRMAAWLLGTLGLAAAGLLLGLLLPPDRAALPFSTTAKALYSASYEGASESSPRESVARHPRGVVPRALPPVRFHRFEWLAQQAGAVKETARITASSQALHRPPRASRTTQRIARAERPTVVPSTIVAEAALLSRARSALRDGQPNAALRLARQHAQEFPSGELAPDRTFLTVAALCHVGQHAAARTEAAAFAARYPRSPLRARVLGLCPTDTNG